MSDCTPEVCSQAALPMIQRSHTPRTCPALAQPADVSPGLIERLCEVMHDAYEVAALDNGWETQERSRKPWCEVPDSNRATMRAAVSAMLTELSHPN